MRAHSDSRPDGAVVLVVVTGKVRRYLALRRAATDRDYPGKWGIVGGMCEPGETATECALRELREETGLEVGQVKLTSHLLSFRDERSSRFMIFPVYILLRNDLPAITLSREHDDFAWLAENEAAERLGWRNLSDLIEAIEADIAVARADTWQEIPFATPD